MELAESSRLSRHPYPLCAEISRNLQQIQCITFVKCHCFVRACELLKIKNKIKIKTIK